MAKRGPKPIPTKVLEMRGSNVPSKRTAEPAPMPMLPECPEWIANSGELAEKLWNDLGAALVRQGVLTEVDTLSFSLLVMLYSDIVRLRTEIQLEGEVSETIRGTAKRNPKQAILKEYLSLWQRSADSFGLSPSSRKSLKVVPPNQVPLEEEDDDDRFFA